MRPYQAGASQDARRRLIDILSLAAAVGGYAFTTALLVQGFASGRWPFPGGDVVDYYARAGDAFRAGEPVFSLPFFYGPPWVVAFGAVSWLGPGAIHAIILVLDAVALWTIAWGNWRRLGYILWFPLVAFDIAAGQLNLVVAAAIVAAQHGITWPLAAMTLAKVWPAVALPPRHWRRFLVEIAVICLVTLPWLSPVAAMGGSPRRDVRRSARSRDPDPVDRAGRGRRGPPVLPAALDPGAGGGDPEPGTLLGAARRARRPRQPLAGAPGGQGLSARRTAGASVRLAAAARQPGRGQPLRRPAWCAGPDRGRSPLP